MAGPIRPGSIRTTRRPRAAKAPSSPNRRELAVGDRPRSCCYPPAAAPRAASLSLSTARMSWIDQRPDDAMAGAFEAVGPDPVVTVDPTLFREAMSRLGAAVHVVTTAGPAGKTGFTATAVCSVSDAPPTLLVCLNRKSAGGPMMRENGVFCVNTLGADAEAIADMFAGRTGAQSEARFQLGAGGTPPTGP